MKSYYFVILIGVLLCSYSFCFESNKEVKAKLLKQLKKFNTNNQSTIQTNEQFEEMMNKEAAAYKLMQKHLNNNKFKTDSSSSKDPPSPVLTFTSYFSTTLLVVSTNPPEEVTTISPGKYFYDEPNKRSRLEAMSQIGELDYYPIYRVTIMFPTNQLLLLNGQCRPIDQSGFYSIFTGLSTANYTGSKLVHGNKVDRWENVLPVGGGFNIYLSWSFNGNKLVERTISYIVDGSVTVTTIRYYDFIAATSFPDHLFAKPSICTPPGIICKQGDVKVIDIYRFHVEGKTDVTDHNVADALGDAYFICQILTGQRLSGDNQLSLIKIKANTTWGQYGPCNGGNCLSMAPELVGQEATEGVKALQGQCQNNDDVGNWWSLTRFGKCDLQPTIGAINSFGNSCSWIQQSVAKTVSIDCLKQQKMKEACIADGSLPFTKAAQVMIKAMATSNSTLGGCPAISTTSFSFVNFN